MNDSSRYYRPDVETLARADIEALQEQKLLRILPHAYANSGLVREVWSEAGVHPDDIRSLADFREKVPFIDKDSIRRYRDQHGDPYGGILCTDVADLEAVFSTSGTTGDPTLVPQGGRGEDSGGDGLARDFWEMGLRPGDSVACMLFTFRGAFFEQLIELGAVPVFFDHHPAEFDRLIRASLELRPTGLYNMSGPLMLALQHLEDRFDVDLRDVFESYRGMTFAGEPMGSRARAAAERWGMDFHIHTSLGDVGAATECREHDGCHAWEDTALVEHLDPAGRDPVADGDRGELVVTSLDNRVQPLIRYRSDDLVRYTKARCGCGRTHGRIWTLGRKGDEVRVQGRSVLPVDIWTAIEAIPETEAALFQLIRSGREVDRLRLRVGYAQSAPDLEERVAASVAEHVGVAPSIELVPNEDLLKLGPPHKIPRVAKH